jgi:hypothetical protein
MRALCHYTFAAIFAILLASADATAQESQLDLTADEIVARHEASWEKLSRLKLEFVTTSQTRQFFECGVAALGSPKYLTQTTSVRLYVNSNRLCGFFRDTAPLTEEQEAKEVLENEYRASFSPTGAVIDALDSDCSRHYANFRVGRSIGFSASPNQMSLKEWVAQAHPTVARDQSDSQATKWILKGSFTTNRISHDDTTPSSRTAEVEVTLNAAKGFAIERVEFKCPPSKLYSRPHATLWTVNDWKDLGDGLFFPMKTRWEASLIGLEDKNSLETEFTSVQIDPADLEDQFKMDFKEDAVIYDYTRRPGTNAVSIWGPDNKPKQTFRTVEEFRAALAAKTGKRFAW